MSAPRLVGRDDELALLEKLVRSLVDDGGGGSCVIAGPAGIGKSALMASVVDRAERAGARVLRARGSELEGTLSFGAVRDLLGPAVVRMTRDEQDVLLTGPAGFARPVLGLGAGEDGDPLYGLFWLTVALAEHRPVLLAVDDLHWIDHESARFCTYLARRIEGLPILLVATAQTHHSGPVAEAVHDLLDVSSVVDLAPLPPDELGDLVPGHPPQEVHRLTGGNPMLVVELVRALQAEPTTPLESVTLRGVGAAVLRRVHGLSPEAVALARAVALSPRPLSLGDAAALAELDEQQAAAVADRLVRAQVFEWEEDRLGFLHPLMRRAVYDDLEPVGRRSAHDRAASTLAARGADAETVAAQLLAAEPRGSAESVRILSAAADDAAARMAPRAVASYLERAVAEPPPDPDERVGLLHRLGRVLLDLGRADAVDVLAAALADARDSRTAIAVDLAHGHLALDEAERACTLLEPYLVDAPVSDEELDVAASWLIARCDVAPDTENSAGISADLEPTTPARRRALVALTAHRWLCRAPAAELREATARILGDLGPHSIFYTYRFLLLGGSGMLEERERIAEDEADRARHTGETARYAAAQLDRATIDNQRGRLRAAEASLRLALEAPDVAGRLRFEAESWLVTTLSMQGRFAEAEELLESMRAPADDTAGAAEQRIAQRRAEIAIDREDYAAAVEPAERALAALPGEMFSATGCDLAVALAATGQQERAEEVAREMLHRAEQTGDPQSVGVACASLGRVLGGEEGLAMLRRGHEVLGRTPFRWNLANTEVALGAALRAAGQRTEARRVLESALEYAVANDAAPIEAVAREELRMCGARPRRAARTGAASLTPSEERIARLAAEGRSNKEIAQHLFVTVKNVEMHLVHAYRKLGVSSRRDLTGVLSDPVVSG